MNYDLGARAFIEAKQLPDLIMDLVEKEMEVVAENYENDSELPHSERPKYHFNLCSNKILIYCAKSRSGITDEICRETGMSKY